jgi:hypothetical protein
VPNTLAHLAVQTGLLAPGAGRLWTAAEPRWIAAGCLIPDLPWILQRAVLAAAPGVEPYGLRTYAIAQASLAVCLLLCGALALASRAPRAVFAVLSLGCLLHLVLDALQTKWANGVHLLAPFDWTLWNAGLFWPESDVSRVLTGAGALAGAWLVWRARRTREPAFPARGRRAALAAALVAAWVLVPLALRGAVDASDSHFVRTLRLRGERAGKPVALDRVHFGRDARGPYLRTLDRERIDALGALPGEPARVSIRGRFARPDAIEIEAHRVHAAVARERASYLGVALIAAVWLVSAGASRQRSVTTGSA